MSTDLPTSAFGGDDGLVAVFEWINAVAPALRGLLLRASEEPFLDASGRPQSAAAAGSSGALPSWVKTAVPTIRLRRPVDVTDDVVALPDAGTLDDPMTPPSVAMFPDYPGRPRGVLWLFSRTGAPFVLQSPDFPGGQISVAADVVMPIFVDSAGRWTQLTDATAER